MAQFVNCTGHASTVLTNTPFFISESGRQSGTCGATVLGSNLDRVSPNGGTDVRVRLSTKDPEGSGHGGEPHALRYTLPIPIPAWAEPVPADQADRADGAKAEQPGVH
jgi:hypothetical protein